MKKNYGHFVNKKGEELLIEEEDISTLENLNVTLFFIKNYGGALFPYGFDYIKAKYSQEQLDTICSELDIDLEDYIEDELENVVLYWDKEDLLRNLSGDLDIELDEDSIIKLNCDKFKPTIESIIKLFDSIEDNIFDGIFDEEEWRDFMMDHYNDLIKIEEKENYDYSPRFILNNLIYSKEPIEENIASLKEVIKEYQEDKDKPLEEKRMPYFVKRSIIGEIEMNEPNGNEYAHLYNFLLDKLCEENDQFGLEIKAYAYYGGNKYVECNFKTSEECLLKLLDLSFKDNYANTLGYIYYYGRVTNGIPEYDKALRYFSMAAIQDNIEAKYKIGDMLKNGYGMPKNVNAAKECYYRLYERVLHEFDECPKTSNLADIALRIGESKEEFGAYSTAAKMYLEAKIAVDIRDNKFDKKVKDSIFSHLVNLYSSHYEEIKHDSILISNIRHFLDEGVLVCVENNFLIFTCRKEKILLDVGNINASYTSSFIVNFDGKIIKGFEEEIFVDSINRNLDGSYSFICDDEEVGRISKCNYTIFFKGDLEPSVLEEIEEKTNSDQLKNNKILN